MDQRETNGRDPHNRDQEELEDEDLEEEDEEMEEGESEDPGEPRRPGRGRFLLILSAVLLIGFALGLWLRPWLGPAVARLFDRRATASALLTVRGHEPHALDFLEHMRRPRSEQEAEEYRATLAALIKSRPVLVKALAALPKGEAELLMTAGHEPDAITWLENEIQVSFLTPEIMEIRLKGDDPEQLKAIVDAVADTFLIDIINKEHVRRAKDLEHLREIEKTFTDRLKRARDAVRKLKERLGAGNDEALALQHELVQMELTQATAELARIRQQAKRLHFDLRHYAEHGFGPEVTEAEMRAAEAADESMLAYQAEKDLVRATLEAIKAKSPRGIDEPKARPWQDRLAQLDEAMKARRGELLSALTEEAKKGDGNRLEALKARLGYLEGLGKALEVHALKLKRKAMDQVARGLDMDEYEREIAELEELVKKVGPRAEWLQIQLERAPPPVELYQRAVVREP